MVSICQMAHGNTAENRRQIQQRDGQRGEEIRSSNAAGIARQINARQEEPQRLYYVAELIEAKYPGCKEAEVQTLIVDGPSNREAWSVEVYEWRSEQEYYHGDDPEGSFESEPT